MAFSTGGSGQQSEINVTPLIDVLLVLLIIFMIIVPTKPSALSTLVPQPPKSPSNPETPPSTIVVQVHANAGAAPTYSINQQPIAKDAIVAKLREIFAIRQEKTMFVKGDPDLDFNAIAEVIGMGRQALVDQIGVLTPKMEAGR